MKSVYKLTFAILILIAGCDQENKPSSNNQECTISSVEREYDNFEYMYNSSGQLKQVMYKYGNGSTEAKLTELQYQSGKVLILETGYNPIENLGEASVKMTVFLNSSGFPVKALSDDEFELWKFVYSGEKLSYTVSKTLDGISEYDSIVVKYDVNNKNLIEENYYGFNSGKWEFDYTIFYTYDDKPNPFKKLIHEDYFLLTQFFSKNNVLRDNSFTYTLTYTNEGYPLTITDGKGDTDIYQYSCK